MFLMLMFDPVVFQIPLKEPGAFLHFAAVCIRPRRKHAPVERKEKRGSPPAHGIEQAHGFFRSVNAGIQRHVDEQFCESFVGFSFVFLNIRQVCAQQFLPVGKHRQKRLILAYFKQPV